MHGGIDLNVQTEFPTTPAQVETMFLMYEANEEPRYMPTPNLNTQAIQQFQNSPFVPIVVKTENNPIINGLGNWGISNGRKIGINEMQFGIGGNGSSLSQQFQLINGVGKMVQPSNFGLVNGGGVNFYQQNPYQVFGGFNMGTTSTNIPRNYQVQFDEESLVLERKHRRLVKNRESAARSRARRLAHNAQQVIEIENLRKENENLRRMIQNFVTVTKTRYAKLQARILKTLSELMETEE